MESKLHISPITFAIPFFVMFAVVGVAMFAAGTGTDLRSHASNTSEKNCTAKCVSMGGNSTACMNVCPKLISGSMTCESAAEAVGVNSPVFLKACKQISPLRVSSCEVSCIGATKGMADESGAVKNICKTICTEVSTGAKSCDQSCSANLPKSGKSYMGMCTKMCKSIPFKPVSTSTGTGTPGITPAGTVTYTPTPTAAQASCAVKCVPPSGLTGDSSATYKTKCIDLCSSVQTGSQTCSQACAGLGNPNWKTKCLAELCSAK